MANKSPRDKCFEEAADEYNKYQPDGNKIEIEHQKPWTIDAVTGKWRPMGTGERLWDWIKGLDPFRVPDWTLTVNGKSVAGDNKFSGDSFQKRVSKRTGNTQQKDLNDMNEDNHPGKKEYQDMSLDEDKCGCGKGEPERVQVYETQPGIFFMPLPGAAPGLTVPSLPSLTMPGPMIEPMPIPVMP